MKKWPIVFFAITSTLVLVCIILVSYIVLPKKYREFVGVSARTYEIEEALVFAVIKTESGFKKNAKSKVGAMGLMQIMPATGKWISEKLGEEFSAENLLDPETNIKYGCYYLNYLFSKFKDKEVVIAAYNAGENVVKQWLNEDGSLNRDKINYSETKKYLAKVLKFYERYKKSEIFE